MLLTASVVVIINTCAVGSGNYGQEKVSLYSKAEGFVVLFFTIVWISFFVGCVLYIVDCYLYVNTFGTVCVVTWLINDSLSFRLPCLLPRPTFHHTPP